MTTDGVAGDVGPVLDWLERHGSAGNRDGMARYGIRPAKVFGVSMTTMRPFVKRLGRSHDLALALWDAGWHEARIVASFVDEPAKVTRAQMDRWCHDFDNWAVCDSVCMHLFDRTPHAFDKVVQWSRRSREFERRAAFALLASLAVHDRRAADEAFESRLPLIEHAAMDERNFVKKAVNWALRQIGKRNHALNLAAIVVAERLAMSPAASARAGAPEARAQNSRPSRSGAATCRASAAWRSAPARRAGRR